MIVNTNGLCNNSPTFSSLPVPYLCTGSQNFYNHGVFDLEGNTVVFSLVDPLEDSPPAGAIPYAPGFSTAQPITTAPGNFTFDTNSGQMIFTPTQQEVDVVTVLVEECDYFGNLIGSVMRDIQVVIIDCQNQPSFLDGGIQNLGPDAVLIDTTTVEVCPGSSVTFEILGIDPDANDTLTMASNLANAIPAATFTTSGVNPIIGSFSWTPDPTDVGVNSFSVIMQDNSCPVPGTQIFGFNIDVLQGAYAGPDQTFCTSGGPTTITAIGGSQFTWTSDNQGNDGIQYTSPNGDTLIVAPPQTTTYYLESNLSSNCIVHDTVVVNWAPDFPYNFPADQDICRFQSVELNFDVTAAPGETFTFEWTPVEGLSDPTIQNPMASPSTTTTYSVIASSSTGCVVTETVTVNVVGVAPIVNINEDSIDTVICPGEFTQLQVKNCCTTCELSEFYQTFAQSPYDTGWDDQKMQILYRADELIDIGITGCNLTSIAFNIVDDYNDIPYEDFTISISETALTDLGALTDFEPVGTQVFQADVDPVIGWNVYTFDAAFPWDGASNILVSLCFNNPDGSWSSNGECDVSFDVTPFTSVYYKYADFMNACVDYLTNDNSQDERPDTRFETDGTGSGTINWSPATTLDNPFITDPTASPTETTTYIIEVSDNGCVGSDSIEITVVEPLGYQAGPDTSICETQDVQLYMGGPANPNFVYTWDPSVGLDNPNSATPIASGVSQTSEWIVTISNTGGCDIIDTVTINFGSQINYFIPNDDTICLGDTYPITASGGDIYEWLPSTGLSCSDCPNPIASPDTTTTYTVYISDAANALCPAEDQLTIVVNPVPNVDTGDDISFYKGETVQLAATGDFTSVEWSPTAGLNDSSLASPIYSLEQDANLIVQANNEYNCSDFDTIALRYLGCQGIIVPTAFSPNNDAVNDQLYVVQTGETEFIDFSVYNRWGERLFYTADPLTYWNGEFAGKRQEVGTYVFIARVRCDGEEIVRRGNVSLIR